MQHPLPWKIRPVGRGAESSCGAQSPKHALGMASVETTPTGQRYGRSNGALRKTSVDPRPAHENVHWHWAQRRSKQHE
eukprot:2492636-Alexandrium_andersonii.AAC.1